MNTAIKIRERFPLSSTPRRVQEILQKQRNEPALIACSAGADSTFLVHWLCAHFPERIPTFTLIHYNHRTRGPAHYEDARFVESLARKVGCGFHLIERPKSETGLSEDSLRASRFSGLTKAMKEKGADYLFLGHNQEDVTETIWMRLSRGSGPEGLSAPRPVSFHQEGDWTHARVRPLLSFSGGSLRAFLEDEGIDWREDSTNHDERYVRNYLRQQVLPVWETYCDRNVHLGAARSRTLLEECSDAIEFWAREIYPQGWTKEELDLHPLRNKPAGLVRFILLRWMQEMNLTVSASLSDDIVEKIDSESGGIWSVGQNRQLQVENQRARILSTKTSSKLPTIPPVYLTPGSTLFFPDGSELSLQEFQDATIIEKRLSQGGIKPEKEAFFCYRPAVRCYVRHWQEGDLYHYLGSPGRRKLQDCFTDKKIPLPERHRLPVVLLENEVLWVPGFPPAEKYKVDRWGSCVLGLTYRKQLERLERSTE